MRPENTIAKMAILTASIVALVISSYSALASKLLDCKMQSIPACTEVIENGGLDGADLAKVYYHRAKAYRSYKKFPEAVRDYGKAIAGNSEYTEAYSGRAMTYADLGKYVEALADHDVVLILEPEYKWHHHARAQTHARFEKHKLAIGDFTKAIELHREGFEGDLTLSHYGRALSHRALGNHREAVDDFTAVIVDSFQQSQFASGNGLAPQSYRYRGQAQIKLDELQEAIADFTELVEAGHSEEQDFIWRGWAHYRSKNYDLVVTDFSEALKTSPQKPDTMWRRGLSYYRL